MWNSEDTGGEESIAMLTLKALTVLYMASAVSSLYFLPVYYGDIDVYADMLRALRLELDWYPSINFALNVNFDFVFAWPADLSVEFQLPINEYHMLTASKKRRKAKYKRGGKT